MSELARRLHAFARAAEPFLPLPRGNDGLTYLERRRDIAQFNATIGYRPPINPERIERRHEVAQKSPGRTWHRSELSPRHS